MYKRAFVELYGKNAVLDTEDAVTSLIAVHKGYKPIKISRGLGETLENVGVLTDAEVIGEGYVPGLVGISDLLGKQKEIYEKHKGIDKILGFSDDEPPLVFRKAITRAGEEVKNVEGYYGPKTGNVYVRLDNLDDI